MPTITFQPEGKSIQVESGVELLTAATSAGIEIASPCGTKGTCGKCVVRLVEGQLDMSPSATLISSAKGQGYVQACQAKISNTAAVIEIPSPPQSPEAQFPDLSNDFNRIDHNLLPRIWQHLPLITKKSLQVPEPKPGDGLSDMDRLTKHLRQLWQEDEITYSLEFVRKIADALRQDDNLVTVAAVEGSAIHLVDILSGDQSGTNYGIAIDVGTTTVSIQLIDLIDGKIVGMATDYNEQIACGVDIISRITYAQKPERQEELKNRVLCTINQLIQNLSAYCGIKSTQMFSAAISGNTTMMHMLLGINPEYIRLDPYVPTVHHVPILKATETGLEIFPDSPVYFSPAIGSYVGGDITAGLFCTALVEDTNDINIFIDIGTNGELVIGNCEFALACACSAGPAFEGGNINCGMRAVEGAIEKVTIDSGTGISTLKTIGNKAPIGICGSGMISLLAELLRTGWIDAAGKLNRIRHSSSIRVSGRLADYIISGSGALDKGTSIKISESEIENIIRAKAAIYAAISLLLAQVGLNFQDVCNIYIAGGFGHYLDLENAISIGLLPDISRNKFRYLGNASLMGTYMMLISRDFREKQQQLAKRLTYIDLSADPQYMEQYTAALFLPHTDKALFPSKA